MMPRLRAQEQLVQVRTGRLVFGGYEQHDAAAMLQELQQQAAGIVDEASGTRRKSGHGELAAAGIGVRMVPPRARPDAEA